MDKMDNIIQGIQAGLKEACIAGIRANAVLINSRFVKVPATAVPYIIRQHRVLDDSPNVYEHTFDSKDCITLPPMIAGLKAYFTDELPDEYAFALCETAMQDEYDNLRAENRRLKETLTEIKELIGLGADE